MINSRKRVSLVENFMSKTAIRTSTIPVIVCMCAKFLISRLKSHRPRSGSSLPRSGSSLPEQELLRRPLALRAPPAAPCGVGNVFVQRPSTALFVRARQCPPSAPCRVPPSWPVPTGTRAAPGRAEGRQGGGGGTQPARCRTVHWARRPSSHLQRTERTAVRNMTQAWSGDRGHGQPYGGQHTHTTADCESWGCDETRPICTHWGPLGGHHQLPPSAPLEWRCIRRHQGSGVSATEAG